VSEPAESERTPDVVPLSRNRDFKIVFVGQGISALGDAVSYTALPLLVLALTGSGVLMGMVGVLSQLPDLIFGLPVGALADRWDRRRMMLLADAARAGLTALIPIAAVLGADTMAVVLLVTFPINFFRVLFMAGWTSAVPNLVGRALIGRAVSLFEAVLSLSYIIGPALAGILVGVIGPAQTLAIQAVAFAVSALTLTLIHRPFRAAGQVEQRHVLVEIKEGIDFIRHHPTLRIAVAWWTAFSIATGGLVASLTYYVRIDRQLDPSWLGVILSAFGLGNLTGALLGGRFTGGRLAPLLLGGAMLQGTMILLLSVPLSPYVLPLCAAAAGVGSGSLFVAYLTLRSSVTPDRLLGRVGSTARTISIGLVPLGTFAAGLLLDEIAGVGTLRVIGLSVIVTAALFALSASMRSARVTHPVEEVTVSGA
jgi:MFS family permease